jgi:hypothetical protein
MILNNHRTDYAGKVFMMKNTLNAQEYAALLNAMTA